MGLVRRRHKCREKTEAGTKKGSAKTSHASAVCVQNENERAQQRSLFLPPFLLRNPNPEAGPIRSQTAPDSDQSREILQIS